MMRTTLCAALAIGLFATTLAAQEQPKPQVPDYIFRMIERNGERAADSFAKRMLDIDPDGLLSGETIDLYGLRGRAVFRAAEMERFFGFRPQSGRHSFG